MVVVDQMTTSITSSYRLVWLFMSSFSWNSTLSVSNISPAHCHNTLYCVLTCVVRDEQTTCFCWQNVLLHMIGVYPDLLGERAPPPLNAVDLSKIPVIILQSSHIGTFTTTEPCLPSLLCRRRSIVFVLNLCVYIPDKAGYIYAELLVQTVKDMYCCAEIFRLHTCTCTCIYRHIRSLKYLWHTWNNGPPHRVQSFRKHLMAFVCAYADMCRHNS